MSDPARSREVRVASLHVRLGRTGLRVSRVAIGTVNFGGRVDEADAHRLLDHAWNRGVNLVDTADIYGWRVHRGWTEEMIGRWLAEDPSRRDSVVLATKVGNPMGDSPNDRGLSARHIIAACEASLRRLQTDTIDLYQMHQVDREVGWDEIWQAMEQLVHQGKVRYVGSSNFAGWDLVSAQEAARRHRLLGLASEQCVYNLVTRYVELEVLPAAAAEGIGVLVWSPLHGGLLSGVLRKREEGTAVKSAQGRAVEGLARHRLALETYERFCGDLGRDPAGVGMAWVLHRPGVTAAVVGPRTPEHLDGALRALEQPLAADELARLDELFPPPGRGGPAPDAWMS
ncbi:aldo/keto reductase [Salinispora arenicola]|uniref:Aldo/keto reductase n=1 Tax=Salinispora arenicola (strain CNS-205) TaxID=391037 RepID=A8LZP2_SALAI|nr:aldo/keto reductase [Salinispora arenicola]NIL58456.1 aldo/keto reductase [Salinispora arenicola]NIL62917.1 aldo/keto reductase [Salinispora arenicola]